MALETIIYDTISATPFSSTSSYHHDTIDSSCFLENAMSYEQQYHEGAIFDQNNRKREFMEQEQDETMSNNQVVQGRKKRRRKPRVCKNKEEAETQRITHITVERNRRKQMNEHLAVLRSLMPESYVQRGDQASIVGGAIEFVKELEHILQSLEARKLQLLQQELALQQNNNEETSNISNLNNIKPPFAQFFVYPQYTWSQNPNNKYTSKTKAAIADIEVTLIETHANLRILTKTRPGQLTKLVDGFQTLFLTILHLNVTTIQPLVFYSISAKVEEGFQLGSVDGIATAVHHLLGRIEEEATLCC
ncbi:unnamed protein product [Vicia faba]|uniref:BHLH domain-containing protein n=1 Tax=Vicia faba TaxID=3906 RepID=A0AAV0YDP0_VICFA|nr:unnamed protein product [Vicia faba]